MKANRGHVCLQEKMVPAHMIEDCLREHGDSTPKLGKRVRGHTVLLTSAHPCYSLRQSFGSSPSLFGSSPQGKSTQTAALTPEKT